jgi:regulatory protein
VESALELARRKRIGPYAGAAVGREQRERQLAQMIRGGHGFTLARRIVDMSPGDDVASLCVE